MGRSDELSEPPGRTDLAAVFDVYEIRQDGDQILYIGEPVVSGKQLEHELWPLFRDRGYQISLKRGYQGETNVPLSAGEFVLVAEPWSVGVDSFPWTNVVLFVLTVLSTLFAGAFYWYQVPITEEPWRVIEAWPFVVAIIGVLGIHELGHYVMSRYHDVQASLPYFIPLPTFIGSMGAVIRMRGRIPDRKALFDIGAAGPLAGILATIVVTAIGLQLDPLPAQEAAVASAQSGETIEFGEPLMLELIAHATGTGERLGDNAGPLHPVVFGGWVGMLVTVLNMLPVGQLDGGHILRAVIGERQRTISAAVPGALFALAAYLFFIRDGFNSVGIWTMWGLFAVGLAYAGPVDPIEDQPLDRKRILTAVVTFVLAALCFTPIPIEIVG